MSYSTLASLAVPQNGFNSFSLAKDKVPTKKENWVMMPSGSQYELGNTYLNGVGVSNGPKSIAYNIRNRIFSPKASLSTWAIVLIILLVLVLLIAGYFFMYKSKSGSNKSFYYF